MIVLVIVTLVSLIVNLPLVIINKEKAKNNYLSFG